MSETDTRLTIQHGGNYYMFDKSSGMLERIETPEGRLSLHEGPSVVPSKNACRGLRCYRDGASCIVEPDFEGGQWLRWTFSPDMPPKIDYSFSIAGETDYIGLGFHYPEEKVKSMEWVGEGPYRVWKNRREGTSFGVHKKGYNNTITGESWTYPEFKGYHADCRAVTIETSEGRITFIPERSGLFFQMLAPQKPQYDGNGFTSAPFPATSFGLMHAIPPVGTKFQKPEQLGPSGQKNMQLNWTPISGSLWLIIN